MRGSAAVDTGLAGAPSPRAHACSRLAVWRARRRFGAGSSGSGFASSIGSFESTTSGKEEPLMASAHVTRRGRKLATRAVARADAGVLGGHEAHVATRSLTA